MKLSFTLLIGVSVVIASCQKSTIAPTTKKRTISSSELQSIPTNTVTRFDNRFDVDLASQGVAQASPCTGEQLKIVSGIYHADTRILI
ncbi:MAG TPA: hypothetical protein VFE54_07405, partial [Mucilaginibacter sp.]|nr:hypothetical protein [Mucilaginibacter sp.]